MWKPSGPAASALGLLSLAFSTSPASYADESRAVLSVVAQAGSDWLYHGVSETAGEPAVGVNAEWQPTPLLFLGVEAHEGHLPSGVARQRQRSVMAYVGTGTALNDSWYASASWLHREFPESQKSWDFSELQATLSHRNGLSVTASFSPDYYDHGTKAYHVELGYRRSFHDRAYGFTRLGALELTAERFTSYRHATLGGGLSLGRLNVELGYAWTSASSSDDFGRAPIDSPGFLINVAYRLR